MYERSFQLGRGHIDLETGEFPAVVFSNGEASDGHIIDVRGMETPDVIPMFANHDADPIGRMGQLNSPHKTGKTTQLGRAFLRYTARLDVLGDSMLADIRRDVAHGISVGDITSMSGRWEEIDTPIARSALAKNHYAFSDVGNESMWGPSMFFPSSRAVEGSIVGLGADPAALIGRARDTGRPAHVRSFWRALLEADLSIARGYLDSLEPEGTDEAESPEGGDLVEIECSRGLFQVPKDVALVWGASVADGTRSADELGDEDDTLDNELSDDLADGEVDVEVTQREEADPAELPAHREEALHIPEREQPESLSLRGGGHSVVMDIAAMLRAAHERVARDVDKEVDALKLKHFGEIRD